MSSSDSLVERARGLLRAAPLVDGHNDLLWELRTRVAYDLDRLPLDGRRDDIMTDLPRLHEGGVGGQFWSVYVPSDLPGHQAVTATLEQIDGLHRLLARYPEALERARTADDVERIAASGRVASMIGVEGGQSIGGSLGALRVLAALGAGYMTLTHNHNNAWADSATDRPAHGGLTRFGEEVVREMNRSGVLVDLSHVSPDTMRHALDVTKAPVVFSHSSARALCDVPRNVPDDVLRRVRDNGGVVMVTFVPGFISPACAAYWSGEGAVRERLGAEHPDDPAAVEAGVAAWFGGHPAVSIEEVANHVDHVRDVAGIEHLGIGGDLDGSPTMPEGLGDVSTYPALFAELLRRGYSDDDVSRVAGRNVLRVMREAHRTAARLQAERPPSTARIEDLDA
jgi:membrane dipeptidase